MEHDCPRAQHARMRHLRSVWELVLCGSATDRPWHQDLFRRLSELPAGILHGGAVLHCGLFFRCRLRSEDFFTVRPRPGFSAWTADPAVYARDRSADAVLPVANLGKWRFRAPMAAASPKGRVAVGNRPEGVWATPFYV